VWWEDVFPNARSLKLALAPPTVSGLDERTRDTPRLASKRSCPEAEI
jgi:hypothetical protein